VLESGFAVGKVSGEFDPLMNDVSPRSPMMMPQVTKLFPVFAVRDLEASLDFYKEKLGFSVAWRWGEPASRAGVALGDIEIQLDAAGAGAPPGPSVVYCHMIGVEAYYDACKKLGVTFSLPLGDRPWGMRDFRVIDLDGNRIGFGEES
jgi:catechol 2,3-dioxygenase-like lactoylglutathione lyase family enzyme